MIPEDRDGGGRDGDENGNHRAQICLRAHTHC